MWLPDEIRRPLGACQIRIRIVDEETPREQKVAREKQPRIAVIERYVRGIVAGGGQHIDCSIAEIHLGNAVGPVGETEILLNAC